MKISPINLWAIISLELTLTLAPEVQDILELNVSLKLKYMLWDHLC